MSTTARVISKLGPVAPHERPLDESQTRLVAPLEDSFESVFADLAPLFDPKGGAPAPAPAPAMSHVPDLASDDDVPEEPTVVRAPDPEKLRATRTDMPAFVPPGRAERPAGFFRVAPRQEPQRLPPPLPVPVLKRVQPPPLPQAAAVVRRAPPPLPAAPPVPAPPAPAPAPKAATPPLAVAPPQPAPVAVQVAPALPPATTALPTAAAAPKPAAQAPRRAGSPSRLGRAFTGTACVLAGVFLVAGVVKLAGHGGSWSIARSIPHSATPAQTVAAVVLAPEPAPLPTTPAVESPSPVLPAPPMVAQRRHRVAASGTAAPVATSAPSAEPPSAAPPPALLAAIAASTHPPTPKRASGRLFGSEE